MHKRSYYIVNAITFYRLIMAPVLIILVLGGYFNLFRWLLVVSFLTDAVDGFFSRRYKVSSVFGSKLDSIADDMTIVAAIVGMMEFYPGFIRNERILIAVLAGLFLLQVSLALIRYGKITSFHTYLAKLAAIMQGIFFLALFFLENPPYGLFYFAVGVTIADLIEEIIMVLMLRRWKSDVKGLYGAIRSRKSAT